MFSLVYRWVNIGNSDEQCQILFALIRNNSLVFLSCVWEKYISPLHSDSMEVPNFRMFFRVF